MKKIFAIVVIVLAPFLQAKAVLSFPNSLGKSDEGKLLSILGYGTATKILGDPSPLGDYDGFELGVSEEIISTDQVATLGAKGVNAQNQVAYNTLSVGKGITQNFDTFLQFAFLGQQENITGFGAQARWGFYRAQYLPIFLTAVLHGESYNFANLVVTTTFGTDLLLSIREGSMTVYTGVGFVRATGQFAGGTGGITASGSTDVLGLVDNRFIAGFNFALSKVFLAVELERVTQPTYALKLGTRF